MAANFKTETLYESDYYLWLEKTTSLLRSGKVSALDLPNLIAEIEDMGNELRSALESNLVILLMHLLKYKYQVDRRSNSWRTTIVEHRRRLLKSMKNSPSLKRYFQEMFEECYQDARVDAATETGLPIDTFPEQSPFTSEQTLNPNYLPQAEEEIAE